MFTARIVRLNAIYDTARPFKEKGSSNPRPAQGRAPRSARPEFCVVNTDVYHTFCPFKRNLLHAGARGVPEIHGARREAAGRLANTDIYRTICPSKKSSQHGSSV